MEVDRADETERRFPEPGDPEAGTPEQYYLPPQHGWVERRIEDVRGRDGPRQWRREVDDRAAPPVGGDGGAADPDVLDPERAGIDHDRMLGPTDTHDLECKARDDRLLISQSESEAPDDAVGIGLDRDGPGGQRSRAEIGQTLREGSVALQERHRIVSGPGDWGGMNQAGRLCFLLAAGGEREHRGERWYRFAEVAVARRQPRQRFRQDRR